MKDEKYIRYIILTKRNLDLLRSKWRAAFAKGDIKGYNFCEREVATLLRQYEKANFLQRYYKAPYRWNNMKWKDLVYIAENYRNTDGIIEYYYSKGDFLYACYQYPVLAEYVFENIQGERVDEFLKNLKQEYYEWFMNEPLANRYKSKLANIMFKILLDEKKLKPKIIGPNGWVRGKKK